MKIAKKYNHLNAEEFLLCKKRTLYREIKKCIKDTDANQCLKISCAMGTIGEIFYDQKELNRIIKEKLSVRDWKSRKVEYYITDDTDVTRKVVNVTDKNEQMQIITNSGKTAYKTYNQVDYLKEKVAVEVQFGKYFSVAYDLHVKHTFLYMRNVIDVGIEIIPTKALKEHMDTGVPWFENEVTNIIREGRSNPPAPILIIGIEPDEDILKEKFQDYSDKDLDNIIESISSSEIDKFENKINTLEKPDSLKGEKMERVQRIKNALLRRNTDNGT